MILALLITKHVLGVPVGITAALGPALALVMPAHISRGVYVFQHLMLVDGCNKLRAALFARGQQLAASWAALTTLGAMCSLLMMLLAQLLSLRQLCTAAHDSSP